MNTGSALMMTGAITSMFTVVVVAKMMFVGIDTGTIAGMAFCGGILSTIQMITGGMNRN